MMKIGFYGAAGEVTGSRHLLDVDGFKVLMDCGLFQGHRTEAIKKNTELPFVPAELDAVLLSHAHVDHCGALPVLAKRGYKGPIHCTEITAELTAIMLLDSAHLQENDALFFNKIHQKDGETIAPLYNEEDARAAIALLTPHPFGEWVQLNDKVRFRFLNAGHVIGSAMIEVEAGAGKDLRRVLFTGDLGRRHTLLMESPQPPKNADYLLIESTYGDRVHETLREIEPMMTEIVTRAIKEKGKILIPSFALERTQELLFVFDKMIRKGQIPPIPLYVDSPMAVSITEIFDKHLDSDSFSQEFKDYCDEGNPFALKYVKYVRTQVESQRLNDLPGPMVILSASGMCEGGRILHHLRNNVDKDTTQIIIVGYQAEGTLGRRLQEGAKKVKIFGLEHPVWARVETIHTFSAHADRDDLMWFMKSLEPRPRTIFLVHGDPDRRQKLAEHLKSEGIDRVAIPEHGESVELS
ncbi:MAG: MBL fold metallo-hydrolase [Elusimicrobia bacterium]|nr:MBL fold metallo-hydrolase [Elusimicrobiota bacterium]